MDVRQLRYFLAVVDCGSVHAAAEELLIAQPSISQALRALERELGSELFHRTGRRLVLTSAGETLVEPAREVCHWLELARSSVEAVEGLHGGRLTMASMPSQSVSPLAGMLRRFSQHHPSVQVSVRSTVTPPDVLHVLRIGAAELGVVANPGSPLRQKGFVVHHIETQSFVLVALDEADLPAGAGQVRPRHMTGARLIVGQPGTGMRRVAESILAVARGSRIVVEIEQREALLPLVLAGVGVAVVAESWRGVAESAGLLVRDLVTPETLHVGLVHRSGRLSPAAEAFLRVCAPSTST